MKGPNHPFVVWASCFLWLISLFAITWSLLLFFCVGDILFLTGTDLVNAFVLLSGIMMLPTNVYMLCSIANGQKIDPKAKVVCCPLWLCIIWVIIVNCVAAMICLQRIHTCKESTKQNIHNSMKYYRIVPKYKHFMDTLQWSMKCCGLKSYRDWFTRDWYDKIRDYEWDPAETKRTAREYNEPTITDSVPLSCCKSGSCISNYLMELGTYSINTNGCGDLMHRIIMTSMNGHLIMFLSIIMVEIIILKFITKKDKENKTRQEPFNVRHLMSVNDNFDVSSNSYQINPDDSDVEEISPFPNTIKEDNKTRIESEVDANDEDYK